MTVAENREISRRFHDEVINGNDWDVARELLAPDVRHLRGAIGSTISEMDPGGAAELRTLSGAERFIGATKLLRSLFERWDSQIQQMIASDDLVFTKCLIRGTVTSGFRGSADRTDFELPQAVVQRIADDRIVEIWALSDQLEFWRDLGVKDSFG